MDVVVMVDSSATNSFIPKSTVMAAGNGCKVNANTKVPVMHAANNEFLAVKRHSYSKA